MTEANDIVTLLKDVKSFIKDNDYKIKINDIIKKKPSFYDMYALDTKRIKEIINSIEISDFECDFADVTNGEMQVFYVFRKNLHLKRKNGNLEEVKVFINIGIFKDKKELLVSIHKVKYSD